MVRSDGQHADYGAVLAQVLETQDFKKSSESPSVRGMVRAEASLTPYISLFAKSRFILSTSARKARSVRGRGWAAAAFILTFRL